MHNDALNQPVPYDWSPDQALAVVEFLETLADQIWSRYGLAIRPSFPGPDTPTDSPQLALPFPPWDHCYDDTAGDPDDDIPW